MTDIEQLKMRLFELSFKIDNHSRKEIMDALSKQIKKTFHANNITFYVYNRLLLDKHVDCYTSNEQNQTAKKLATEIFPDIFHQSSTMTKLEADHLLALPEYETNILLKINKTDYFYSFVLMNYKEECSNEVEKLKELQTLLEQFLTSLFSNRHNRYIQRRDQLMFELSTKLHSVHHTNDVLEEVHQTIQIMYPNYSYHFLMAHEIEYSSLPVKIIEYSQDTTLNPGIIALINNELQFEYNEKEQSTHIYCPMDGNQGVYGVFQLIVPQIINYVDSEIKFLTGFTNMIGRAIERTTLYQSSNRQVTDLQIINVASHEFNENLKLDDITEIVKKHIYNSCYAEEIGVVLFETEHSDETIEILDRSTSYFYTDAGNQFVKMMEKQMKLNQKPFLSGDYESEGMNCPYRSLMVIPLKTSESLLGMIIIAHQETYYFSFDKYKFIQSLVQHASLAFTNSILNERLHTIATTDHLTKLYERSHIDHLIKEDMEHGERGALILFDIDDFKLVNDTYGHYIGDQVLVQVAEVIQAEMEVGQVGARWGGEEFAVYLPNASISESMAKANTIRKNVHFRTEPKVSLSSGVSVWETDRLDSIEHLFIRADKALYEAKETGKNKVVQNVEKV